MPPGYAGRFATPDPELSYSSTGIAPCCLCSFAASVLIFSGTVALAAIDIVIGSSRPGGSYFLYTGGITTYLTERSKVVNATARTTRGSVENARAG